MTDDIQHHLVHARDLAQTAAQLFYAAQEVNDSNAQRAMSRTAGKLLEQADRLLEGAE